MAVKKRSSSFGKIIRNLIFLVPSLFSFFSNITTLLSMEARLAGKAVFRLIILAVIAAIVVTSLWFCLLTMLYVYLVTLHLSSLLSLFIVFMLNIVLLIIIGFIISRTKKDLLFPMTSSQCRSLYRIARDD